MRIFKRDCSRTESERERIKKINIKREDLDSLYILTAACEKPLRRDVLLIDLATIRTLLSSYFRLAPVVYVFPDVSTIPSDNHPTDPLQNLIHLYF